MERLLTIIRTLINDLPKSGIDCFKYINSNTFNLSCSNIIANTIKVYVNGIETNNYVFDSLYSKLTILDNLTLNDIITINYKYLQYSDNELYGYINIALTYLSIYKVANYYMQNNKFFNEQNQEIVLNLKEEYLIALLTSISINQNLKSLKTPEFSFVFAENLSKEEKIKILIDNYNTILGYFDYATIEYNDN